MSAGKSIQNFFKKYVSRKFIVSTIAAPAVVQYAIAHGWPIETINHLLLLMGVGVGSIGAVDVVNANRGFKREDE